jgi:pimeloyl-ACP methyl ester carboxylesterase
MKNKYLLIPGNPSIAKYYHSWIDEIISLSKAKVENITFASSHICFDRKLSCVEYDHHMKDYYENIFLKLSDEGEISIIAHSVGAYFALHLLEKYPEKIGKIIILFPYIGYSKIKSLFFIKIPYYIDRVFPLTNLVSKYKDLVSNNKYLREISSYELCANLRFGIKQCTYFDKYKFDIQSLKINKEKIKFIYRDDDKWCPKKTIELLRPISEHKKVDLPHDFILNQKYRIHMIKELEI